MPNYLRICCSYGIRGFAIIGLLWAIVGVGGCAGGERLFTAEQLNEIKNTGADLNEINFEQVATDVTDGIAAGSAVGSAFGPFGSVVGGIIGGIVGGMGKDAAAKALKDRKNGKSKSENTG
ncbi:MAG: hypothetical protein AAGJ54_05790 [Planctomycetota bacterium]